MVSACKSHTSTATKRLSSVSESEQHIHKVFLLSLGLVGDILKKGMPLLVRTIMAVGRL